jgi:hypothetical protein
MVFQESYIFNIKGILTELFARKHYYLIFAPPISLGLGIIRLISGRINEFASLAQLVEQLTCNQ